MNETQALMQQIAIKERELQRRSLPPLWPPRPRERLGPTTMVTSVLVGMLACVAGLICAVIGGCMEESRTPSGLSAVAHQAPAIPWRHYSDGRRCHVWVSELGLHGALTVSDLGEVHP